MVAKKGLAPPGAASPLIRSDAVAIGSPMASRVKRLRPVVQLTLSVEAIERVDEMAARLGLTRSGIVERWCREQPMPAAIRATKKS
jgi:Ribbon-helix-helix protein, copG family